MIKDKVKPLVYRIRRVEKVCVLFSVVHAVIQGLLTVHTNPISHTYKVSTHLFKTC